jgi:hypothetical protein
MKKECFTPPEVKITIPLFMLLLKKETFLKADYLMQHYGKKSISQWVK